MAEKDKSLSSPIPSSVDKALENLTDGPTKEIGNTLSDIFFLVFGRIHQAAKKRQLKYDIAYKNYQNEILYKASQIPETNLVYPDLQIVGPALDASKYCIEKKSIRQMFVNLITATMDSSKCDFVRPSFAHTISQLLPLDAQNIALFRTDPVLPLAVYSLKLDDGIRIRVLKTNVFLSNPQEQDINKQASSIASLMHLGLLDFGFNQSLPASAYDIFYKEPYFLSMKAIHDKQLLLEKAEAQLTPFASEFLKVCLDGE